MIRSLVQTVAPTVEPVSLEEALAFLRVDNADESPLIEALVSTAREIVEDFTGRALLTSSWRLTLGAWPDGCGDDASTIVLARTPLASVESVKYYPADGSAQATLSAAAYHVLTGPKPGLLVLKSAQTWPSIYDRPDAVEVNFTSGAPDVASVPRTCRHAVMLLLSHLYENRGAINIGNIVNELPYSLKHLMESQRVGGWVA